jgi:hypothetical protein
MSLQTRMPTAMCKTKRFSTRPRMDSVLIQDDRWVDACRAALARIEAR